jgi:hypothetical protein
MVRVKVYMTLHIDPEEYHMPSDGNVDIEIEEAIQEYFFDVDGVDVKSIKTIQEN